MNNSTTPKWISRLCEDVQDGRFSANLSEEEFNEVLKWLFEREFTVGRLISQSMLRFFDNEDKARQNTFLALDDSLFVFSNESPFAKLGLSDAAELAAVKVRYRRLIQLYHPDKGLAEAAGLSHRAEKINRAYDLIKSGQYVGKQLAPAFHRETTSAPFVASPSPDRSVYRSNLSDNIRWALGSPKKMTFVLMSVLVIAAIGILFSVYSGNQAIEYPQYGERAGAQNASTDTVVTGAYVEKRFTSIADLSEEPKRTTAPAAVVKQTETPVLVTESLPKPESRPKPEPAKAVAITEPAPRPKPEPAKAVVITEPVPKPEPELAKAVVITKPVPKPESKSEPAKAVAITKPVPKPEPAATQTVVVQKPVPAPVAIDVTSTTEANVKMTKGPVVSEALKETPVVAKRTDTSEPLPSLPSTRRIVTLSERDRQQSINVLVGYVDGMIEGNVSKSLNYLHDTVLVDGEQTRKDELRQVYSDWLNESTQHEYKVRVSDITVHNGLVRISGKTDFKFKYAEREPVRYKGVLFFDIQLDTSGGKIVAITRG